MRKANRDTGLHDSRGPPDMQLTKLQRLLLVMSIAFGCVPYVARAVEDTPVEVIAHPSVDESYLTPKYLRAVFTMHLRTWPDGQPVHFFVLEDKHPVHQAFCRQHLGTYPYVLRTIWDRRVFTGTGVHPEVVRNEEEMRQEVFSTPGAIGYISPARVGLMNSPLLESSARTTQ